MIKDEVVEEVRRARLELFAESDYDLEAYFQAARERQKKSGRQAVSFMDKQEGNPPEMSPSGAAVLEQIKKLPEADQMAIYKIVTQSLASEKTATHSSQAPQGDGSAPSN